MWCPPKSILKDLMWYLLPKVKTYHRLKVPQAYTLYNIHVYARCTCMYMFRAELKPAANHDNDCNSGYLGIRININGQIKLLLFKHINICINLFVHSSLTMHPVNVSVCLSVFLSDCDQFSNTGQKCAKLFNSDFRGKNTFILNPEFILNSGTGLNRYNYFNIGLTFRVSGTLN